MADPAECQAVCDRHVAYTIDSSFDAGERGLIEDAMRAWEQGTGGRVCFSPGGKDLLIAKADRAEYLAPVDAEWSRHVAYTKGSHIWFVRSAVTDPGMFRTLGIHELGHHLGLGHTEDVLLTYMHRTLDDAPLELRENALLPERDRRAYCVKHRCTCEL